MNEEIKTGISALDECIGGIYTGDCTLLLGDTSLINGFMERLQISESQRLILMANEPTILLLTDKQRPTEVCVFVVPGSDIKTNDTLKDICENVFCLSHGTSPNTFTLKVTKHRRKGIYDFECEVR